MSVVGERLVEESFELVARVRRARVFHPRGLWFSGRLRPAPAVEEYFGDGEREVEVRLSKALGMPGRLPDALGIGIRVQTPGGRWDLALASTPTGTLTRFIPIPVPSWRRATYGSLMAYRFDSGAPLWIFARPEPDQPSDTSVATLRDYAKTHGLGFTLTTGRLNGPEEPFADLRLTAETVTPPSDDAIDPTLHHPPGVALAPRFVTRIRRSAYQGSREGRGAEK